ncbi:hypothetical protein QU3_0844 [Clostridioides difficile P42]|nr:hypothetical protein QU3_0844 [Clostridioides difficile P42]
MVNYFTSQNSLKKFIVVKDVRERLIEVIENSKINFKQ